MRDENFKAVQFHLYELSLAGVLYYTTTVLTTLLLVWKMNACVNF
jgi:hypothetical protein